MKDGTQMVKVKGGSDHKKMTVADDHIHENRCSSNIMQIIRYLIKASSEHVAGFTLNTFFPSFKAHEKLLVLFSLIFTRIQIKFVANCFIPAKI